MNEKTNNIKLTHFVRPIIHSVKVGLVLVKRRFRLNRSSMSSNTELKHYQENKNKLTTTHETNS
jgi:hypothetical protein